MLFDSHAHVNFNAFRDDGGDIVRRCLDNDIWMVNVGSQYSTSERAVAIAKKYPEGVYAAIGLHPFHLFESEITNEVDNEKIEIKSRAEEFDPVAYRKLAVSKKVVAIGETGLDYFYITDHPEREMMIQKQKEIFVAQAELASKLNLPLIIHCRPSKDNLTDAYLDIVDILRGKNLRGVIHCFSSNLEVAQKFIDLDFYLGFTGIITFKIKKESDLQNELIKVVKNIPPDKILIETDCPYLSPEPMRGKRNEPAYVQYVGDKIAEILNRPKEEIYQKTSVNAKKLFKI